MRSLIMAAIKSVRLTDRKKAAIMLANFRATRLPDITRSKRAIAQSRDAKGRFARGF